jgi:hypothetical protein
MMLTREVLEAVTLTDFNCLQGNCRGSACGFMRHTPGDDWLCEAPTPNELAACALELMAERDQMRAALEGLRINRDEWKTRACQEELRADALEIERDRYRAALELIDRATRDYGIGIGATCNNTAHYALEPVQKEAAHAEADQ